MFTPGVWFINDKGDLTATKDEAIWTDRDFENFILDLIRGHENVRVILVKSPNPEQAV